jgi:hypothetical protein
MIFEGLHRRSDSFHDEGRHEEIQGRANRGSYTTKTTSPTTWATTYIYFLRHTELEYSGETRAPPPSSPTVRRICLSC